MSGYVWAFIGAVIGGFVGSVGLGLLRRRKRKPAPAERATKVATTPTLPGPVEEWPWGQKPSTWMLDPSGHLAGPLSNPEGWMAAHRSHYDKKAT